MDKATVVNAIIEVISVMEQSFGKPPPALKYGDVPEDVCSEFDSKLWPVAISRIARQLDVIIPKEIAVFGKQNGAGLSIAESADKICKTAQSKQLFMDAAE